MALINKRNNNSVPRGYSRLVRRTFIMTNWHIWWHSIHSFSQTTGQAVKNWSLPNVHFHFASPSWRGHTNCAQLLWPYWYKAWLVSPSDVYFSRLPFLHFKSHSYCMYSRKPTTWHLTTQRTWYLLPTQQSCATSRASKQRFKYGSPLCRSFRPLEACFSCFC